MAVFFEGFELERLALSAGPFRLRRGGNGLPLLLLHGNPQTHAMWHKVAPALAREFTVFCPDLRGYGESFKPAATAGHAAAAKREMARNMVELMQHDRASRDAGEKIRCPLLVLWGSKAKIEAWYDALAIWRGYRAAPVSGGPVPSGHYLAEEAPEAVLRAFLT